MTDPNLENPDQENLDEELLEEGEQEDQESNLGWTGWLISGGIHAILLIILIYYVIGPKPEIFEPPATRVANIPPPPKEQEKPKERSLETKVEINVVKDTETPSPITALDLPIETAQRDEDSDSPQPKGREEAVADSEMVGSGAFMAIGAGGGSSGMFGFRNGGGRKRAIGQHGGSRGSESAVEAGLRWLKKHQSPNGVWDVVNYPMNCTEDPKCEPGHASHGPKEGADIAMTGYALLCFLGAGYDHKTANKFRDTVKRGVEYLVSVQKADGRVGPRNYENGVAVMALCETYAMTNDADLKDPAQKGINSVLACQSEDPKAVDKAYSKFAWDYGAPNVARNDSSVSGWNVMALKSGLAAGLDVGQGIEGSKNWLKRTWKAANPDWATLDIYKGESKFPYTMDATTDKTAHENLACVGLVACVFLGHQAGDVMLETMANWVMKHQTPGSWADMATYYNYYNTLGIFQLGGEKWKKWNDTVRDLLVNAQRKGEGCFDGSWNFADSKPWPGSDTGRILSTCYTILSLEVYYRYAQVSKGAGKKGK